MPQPVWTPQVVQKSHHHQRVAQEGGENRGPQDGFIALDIENLDDCYQRKAPRAARPTPQRMSKAIQIPQGNRVAEVGRPAQPIEDAQLGGIQSAEQDGRKDGAPDRDFRQP